MSDQTSEPPKPEPQPDHVHNWNPMIGWSGRYRCSSCKCIGFKRVVMGIGPPITQRNTATIQPYACEKCGGWAVQIYKPGKAHQTKYPRCHAHRHEGT